MQITKACLAGDPVFFAGDFNAKLGRQFYSGDIHDINGNSNRLSKVINEFNLEVLNTCEKCHSTFTSLNNKNSNAKSVLDYLIVSSELNKYTNSMSIDEKKTTVYSIEDFETFSDHNAILLNIDLPLKGGVQKSVRKTTWNFNDQSGWEKFASLTERDSALTDCWKDSSSVEVSYRTWEKRRE